MSVPLEILYQDNDLIAINKPHGLLVHASSIARDVDVNAIKLLRNQIGQYVYPIHRLDRKTSGVLLFGLNKEIVRTIKEQFDNRTVNKKYIAIVRGYFPTEEVVLDYPLINDKGKVQTAITRFNLLDTTELDIPFGRHDTSRYSLVDCSPVTGRYHQIRKHLAHLRHPIIGDRPHGCNKQNRMFKERWNMTTMMLHACSLEVTHKEERLLIIAGLTKQFIGVADVLNLKL